MKTIWSNSTHALYLGLQENFSHSWQLIDFSSSLTHKKWNLGERLLKWNHFNQSIYITNHAQLLYKGHFIMCTLVIPFPLSNISNICTSNPWHGAKLAQAIKWSSSRWQNKSIFGVFFGYGAIYIYIRLLDILFCEKLKTTWHFSSKSCCPTYFVQKKKQQTIISLELFSFTDISTITCFGYAKLMLQVVQSRICQLNFSTSINY